MVDEVSQIERKKIVVLQILFERIIVRTWHLRSLFITSVDSHLKNLPLVEEIVNEIELIKILDIQDVFISKDSRNGL